MTVHQPWPVPGETALDRSRAIARSLLAALQAADPQAAERHVRMAETFGELWLSPSRDLTPDADDRRLTTAEAALLVGRHEVTIRKWINPGTRHGRLTRHPDGIDERELLDLSAALRRASTRKGQLDL